MAKRVQRWFAISLASLQQTLVGKATRPGWNYQFSWPTDDKRQMIRNAIGCEDVSTLGLAIILILGTSLVILGFSGLYRNASAATTRG
jgi:hypothetical protein